MKSESIAPRSAPGPSRTPPPPLAGGLYVVATPIGNLRDITLRALDTLAAADWVLCEDTRLTGRLLTHFGLKRPLLPYHEHNAAEMRPKILALLGEGKALALVSDAGTPLISDPGYKLIAEAAAAGLPLYAVPGASSVTAALSIGGLPTDRFFFVGFLPPKQAARRQRLGDLRVLPGSLVILEAPQRLAQSLRDMADILGPRQAAIARELTKIHEEVRRGSLPDLAGAYAAEAPPKGELVVLIAQSEAEAAAASPETIDAALRDALAQGLALKDAAAVVAALHGLPRREVYARGLALKQGRGA
jgi:16S rRNA (cytidine1402-2'-O)-methyltransferase